MSTLDLNLLVPLKTLLELRNVSRTATALHMSQPAMSTALKKLRLHFKDELLVRAGREFELTPLAERMKPDIDATVALLEKLSPGQEPFDPERLAREFVIAASDYMTARLGRPLRKLLRERGPGISIAFESVSMVTGDETSFAKWDLIIGPMPSTPAYTGRRLSADEFVAIVDHQHPLLGQESISLDELGALPQARGSFGDRTTTPGDEIFASADITIDTAMRVPGFEVLPSLIEGTDLCALVPRSLAQKAQQQHALAILEFPEGRTPLLVESMHWHAARTRDSANSWLRGLVIEAARDMLEAVARETLVRTIEG
jgi:DNA-binding transcriptional LysR family regulator